MIHGLNSRQGAKGFADALSERKKDKIKKNHFEVSSENYAIIQIHKNLDDYLAIDFSKISDPSGEGKEKPRLLKPEQDKVRDPRIIEKRPQIRNNSKSDKTTKDSK